MSTKHLRVVALLVCMGLLGACAQAPVNMSSRTWADKNASIAIVVVKVPTAATHKIGAQGLLDMAINNGIAGPVDTRLAASDVTKALEDFQSLGKQLQDQLTARGVKVVGVYTDYSLPQLNSMHGSTGPGQQLADKDYRTLAADLKADRALIIIPVAAGTVRSYYGFIPTSQPSGNFLADGEIVDLRSDELLWYIQVNKSVNIQSPWDAAPDYPNLTSAAEQAEQQARTDMFMAFQQALAGSLSTSGELSTTATTTSK
jgi:hypothetical protein